MKSCRCWVLAAWARCTAPTTADGKLMAVRIPDSDPRRAAPPKELFATQLAVSDAFDQFAVRGDRFVIRAPVSTAANPNTIQVVVNWKSGSR